MLNIEIKASSRYPIRRRRIKNIIKEVLENYNIEKEIGVEVNIVGDRKMRGLKRDHLGIDKTTDVLSFPLQEEVAKKNSEIRNQKSEFKKKEKRKKERFVEFPDGVLRLGTIIISYPQAQRQANLHKLTIDEEIDRLVEHGMLHLIGIHHE